jgi:hypothetical protein
MSVPKAHHIVQHTEHDLLWQHKKEHMALSPSPDQGAVGAAAAAALLKALSMQAARTLGD